MKTKTKPTLALLTLILLANCTAFAQTSYLKNRWAAQATFIPDFRKNFGDRKVHQFYGGANYGISRFLEVGAYIGAARYPQFSKTSWQRTGTQIATLYGLKANAQLLPILFKEGDFRFDLYLSGKAGGYYCPGKSDEIYNGAYWQYFLGGGIAYYPFKHLGLFVEYGFENKSLINSLNHDVLNFGISYKF